MFKMVLLATSNPSEINKLIFSFFFKFDFKNCPQISNCCVTSGSCPSTQFAKPKKNQWLQSGPLSKY